MFKILLVFFTLCACYASAAPCVRKPVIDSKWLIRFPDLPEDPIHRRPLSVVDQVMSVVVSLLVTVLTVLVAVSVNVTQTDDSRRSSRREMALYDCV